MANVFTKKYKKPRSTTLSDYGGHDPLDCIREPQILSPTRVENPHPLGLEFQFSQNKSTFAIWNPEFTRLEKKMPKMLSHLKSVNFCCGDVEPAKRLMKGKVPEICYSYNTTSRDSFRNPNYFPTLKDNLATTRYGSTGNRGPASGIVPSVIPKEYKLVPEHI